MKDYKDLDFYGPNESLRTLPLKLERLVPPNWRRAPEMEARISQSPDSSTYVFACSAAKERPAAGLCLTFRNPEDLYVCNIVPDGSRSLSFDEYNGIIDEFVSFAKKPAEAAEIRVETSNEEWRIEDTLSPDALDKLQRFSRTANRTTKNSHPSDQKSWFQFVIASHKEDSSLDASDLLRWLVEAESWPEPQAQDIASDYEIARALLSFYDNHE